jgi:hypothetical protein
MQSSLRRLPFAAALTLAWLAVFGAVAKAEPRATASLSRPTISVGDAITMTIEVSGVQQLNPPNDIAVEGLEISYRGYQQSTQILNGQVNRSVSLTYSVEAKQPGAFVIPRIEIRTDAGALKTEALKLIVAAAAPGSKSPVDANGNAAIAFAEIEVSKKSVYLGETVPVEVRLFVDSKVRWDVEEMPVLEGEGFTKVKFPRPRKEIARKDGREFDVMTFRTAISPGKAGKVQLGPMDLALVVSIPRAKPNRRRSPLDMFSDGFFDDPFGAFGATERRKVQAGAIELEVKPLPANGRPKDFSGAVGQFQMAAEGAPKKVKVGDPVTLKMRISGKGNFDRVNAPTLIDEIGWHAYPASGDFKGNDELGFSGVKNFEMAVVPEEKKSAMPQVQFSYFDPEAEKYVTLKSQPAQLTVEGGAPPPPAPLTPAQVAAKPAATPSPEKQPTADILGLKYEFGVPRSSFDPVYRSRIFWLAQGVPLLGLLGLLGVRFLRKGDAESHTAALRRERNALWQRLRGDLPQAEFFQNAARLVQVETALATGRPAGTVDALAARSSCSLDEETAAGIDAIFAARGELLYAGTARSDGRVPATDRERVLATLEHFSKCHAKS